MKRILYCGALALGFLFTACQSDELPNGPDVANKDGDQTFYVNMRISGDVPDMSRASGENGEPFDNNDDFAEGSEDENRINNAFFVFYDSDGNVVGDLVQVELDKLKADDEAHGATVEKCYKSTVAVTVRKGGQKPAQVICYINPIDPSNLSERLNVIQTVARDNIYKVIDNKRYFAMSNSVYYPVDPNDKNKISSEPQVAVTIPNTSLYDTEEGALRALNNVDDPNVINIYVERYATKLSFSGCTPEVYNSATRVYEENSLKNDIIPVDLTFVPEYWAVNAESKQSYVIKSFREESSLGDILINNYSYETLNERINGDLTGSNAWKWNNPTFRRSYWGMSPAYFQDEYPEVTSDLPGITDIKQSYIPYEWLEKHTKGYEIGAEDGSDKKAHYFKETTVGSMALASANPAAAVASVIYVGRYELSVNGVNVKNPTFYTYLRGSVLINGQSEDRPYIYFDGTEADPTKSAVNGGESLLKRMFAQSTILFRKKDNTAGTSSDDYEQLVINDKDDLAILTDALEVAEISDDVKKWADGNANTKMKLRNNSRGLQFKKGKTTANTGIYIVTQNGYKEIVADDAVTEANKDVVTSVTQANIALMRQVGLAYKYHTGHAYFSIPVKHLGWYRPGNEQKNVTTASGATEANTTNKIDWSKVRVGDFGMVRNHSYTVSVETITGLADGIGSDDAPIVPPSTSTDYFMAYSVRILKWAVVPTQHVKL